MAIFILCRAWHRLADVLRSWLHTSASEDETERYSTRLELEGVSC